MVHSSKDRSVIIRPARREVSHAVEQRAVRLINKPGTRAHDQKRSMRLRGLVSTYLKSWLQAKVRPRSHLGVGDHDQLRLLPVTHYAEREYVSDPHPTATSHWFQAAPRHLMDVIDRFVYSATAAAEEAHDPIREFDLTPMTIEYASKPGVCDRHCTITALDRDLLEKQARDGDTIPGQALISALPNSPSSGYRDREGQRILAPTRECTATFD